MTNFMTNLMNNEIACDNNIAPTDMTVGAWLSNVVSEQLEHSDALSKHISAAIMNGIGEDNLNHAVREAVSELINEDAIADTVSNNLSETITENVAANVDAQDVAEYVANEIDNGEVADQLDLSDIAGFIPAEELAAELWSKVERKVEDSMLDGMFVKVVAQQLVDDTCIVHLMCDKMQEMMMQRQRDNQLHRRVWASCKQLASKLAAKFRTSEVK